MVTFVSSRARHATRAHIGSSRATACGEVLTAAVRVTRRVPSERAVCPRCVNAARARGTLTTAQAARLLPGFDLSLGQRQRRRYLDSDVAAFVALLLDGHNDGAAARRLGVCRRTVARYAEQGMADLGARTRFQWAYRLGLAAGAARAADIER